MSHALLDPGDELHFGPELSKFEPCAIIGTRVQPWRLQMTPLEIETIQHQVDELPQWTLVMSGGSRGAEAIAHRRAAERELTRLALLPAVINWVDWDAVAGGLVVRTRMRALDRDRRLINAARRVVIVGLREPGREPRSSIWAAARYAQERGVLHRTVILRPKFAEHPTVELGNDICVCHPRQCGCSVGRDCSCTHHQHR